MRRELHTNIEAWAEPEDHLWEIHIVASVLNLINGTEIEVGENRDESPLTFAVTATGETAASLRDLAFVADKSIEEIALHAIDGISSHATEPAELLDNCFNQIRAGEAITPTAERFQRYRDANGLDYPDFVLNADVDEAAGLITHEERRKRVLAGGGGK